MKPIAASLPEVLDIFRGWFDARAVLQCNFEFAHFIACFRARVFFVSSEELKLVSEDTFSELVLRLTPDLTFEYVRPDDADPESDEFIESLAVRLSAERPDVEDLIVFSKVVAKS